MQPLQFKFAQAYILGFDFDISKVAFNLHMKVHEIRLCSYSQYSTGGHLRRYSWCIPALRSGAYCIRSNGDRLGSRVNVRTGFADRKPLAQVVSVFSPQYAGSSNPLEPLCRPVDGDPHDYTRQFF